MEVQFEAGDVAVRIKARGWRKLQTVALVAAALAEAAGSVEASPPFGLLGGTGLVTDIEDRGEGDVVESKLRRMRRIDRTSRR